MSRNKGSLKGLNTLLIALIVIVWLAGIATGFSFWIFEDGLSKTIPLSASVISDDIRENYQVSGGTGDNSQAFKVAGDSNKSSYTYKLLGGYNSDSKINYDYDQVDSSRTFTEVNFNEGDGGKNTIYQAYGRLFYIDMVYFGSKDGVVTSNYNVTPSLSGTFDGVSLSNFSLNVKHSGYSIARSSSDGDGYNTDNWINIIGQKDYFEYKYADVNTTDSTSSIYNWFCSNIVAEINTQLKWHYLNFFYDHGRVAGDDAEADDYISTFNADKDMTKTGGNFYFNDLGSNNLTQTEWEDTVRDSMDRKFFSNKKDYGYYNVLLFIPFKRNYQYPSTWTDGVYRYGVSDWVDGKIVEEDFGYVALYPASKSLDSSIQNFMKIIDYSNVTAKDIEYGNAFIPTVYNGGFKHDSEGYIDYAQNFVDNGNLFIDTMNVNPYAEDESAEKVYRRVFGISNNYTANSYGDPTYDSSASKDDFALGGIVENVYYYYDSTDYAYYEGEATEAKNDLEVTSVTDLTTIKDAFGNVTNCKLIDHLTLEDVDFTKLYTYDEDGLRVEGTESGIHYDKSMILLLVQEDVNPKEIIIRGIS